MERTKFKYALHRMFIFIGLFNCPGFGYAYKAVPWVLMGCVPHFPSVSVVLYSVNWILQVINLFAMYIFRAANLGAQETLRTVAGLFLITSSVSCITYIIGYRTISKTLASHSSSPPSCNNGYLAPAGEPVWRSASPVNMAIRVKLIILLPSLSTYLAMDFVN